MLLLATPSIMAQADWHDSDSLIKAEPTKGLAYKVEMQASASKGKTPLWLNANRHGLSSLDKTNGYIRAAIERPLHTDSLRRWGLGYGLDIVAPLHYTSHFIVQQQMIVELAEKRAARLAEQNEKTAD